MYHGFLLSMLHGVPAHLPVLSCKYYISHLSPIQYLMHSFPYIAHIVDEWVPVAIQLSQSGNYVTVLVYTHLLHKQVSHSDMLSVLHDTVMTEVLQASHVVVMGKSAGGGLAQEFAFQYPENLLALVLAAPSSSNPDHISTFCPSDRNHMQAPLFLAWAADDASFGKSNLWLETCQRKRNAFSFYSAKSGGHRVLPEYAAQIQSFFDTYHVVAI